MSIYIYGSSDFETFPDIIIYINWNIKWVKIEKKKEHYATLREGAQMLAVHFESQPKKV